MKEPRNAEIISEIKGKNNFKKKMKKMRCNFSNERDSLNLKQKYIFKSCPRV